MEPAFKRGRILPTTVKGKRPPPVVAAVGYVRMKQNVPRLNCRDIKYVRTHAPPSSPPGLYATAALLLEMEQIH